MSDELWKNNLVQFARLLSEIRATAVTLDPVPLTESMDITFDELEELFDRAGAVWEASKAGLPVSVSETLHTDSRFQLVLDLSTGHMPSPEPEWGRLRVVSHEQGVIVFVPGDADEAQMAEEPEWVRPILAMAREQDCMLVNFDPSGEEVDDLPTWEW